MGTTTNLMIRETFVNVTKGRRFNETAPYETFTSDRGELYRHLRREYGRCTSRVYVDDANGPRPVGWVFLSRQKYDDERGVTYLREVWVEVCEPKEVK